MHLFNVNFRNDINPLLVPKIPYSAADDEDKITKRICLSNSAEHCIQAIGPADRDLHKGSIIVVKCINVPIDEKVITPQELYDSGKVPDALENMEYWYSVEVKALVQKFEVLGFDYERDLAWTCISTEDVHKVIKKLTTITFSGSTSQEVYNNACKFFNDNRRYDDLDEIYDRLAELPWAQALKITNLQVKPI